MLNDDSIRRSSLLVCEIDGAFYGFELASVSSLQRADAVRAKPAASGIVGEIPMHRRNVPVLDLAARYGLAPARLRDYAVVVEASRPHGVLVDRVVRRAFAEPGAIRPLDIGGAPSALVATLVEGEEIVVVLSPEGLLAERDRGRRDRAGGPVIPSAPTGGARRVGQMIRFAVGPRAGGVSAALALGQVEEVVRLAGMVPLLGAPPNVLGLVPWRRRAVPVIDTGEALGLGTSRVDAASRCLVIRDPRGRTLALLSGGEPRLETVPTRSLVAHSAPMCGGSVIAEYSWNEERLVVPAIDRLLSV